MGTRVETWDEFYRQYKTNRGTTMAGNDTKECPHTVITEDGKFCQICGVTLETLKNNLRPKDKGNNDIRRSVGGRPRPGSVIPTNDPAKYCPYDVYWPDPSTVQGVPEGCGDDSPATQLPDATKRDNVNGPEHYQHRDGVQTIDVVHQIFSHEEFITCMVYNVIKYVARYKRKGGLEDLKKAERYVKWAIEEMETGKITHE